MVDTDFTIEAARERRRQRADRQNPIDPDDNFRQWKAIVGLPHDFPRLGSLEWDALHPERSLYLNPRQTDQTDQMLTAALSPTEHPLAMVTVKPGQGTSTLASYTFKRMTDYPAGYPSLALAQTARVLPVGAEVHEYTKRGVSLERELQEGIMIAGSSYEISGIAGMPLVETLAVVLEKGITPEFMIDLSGFTGDVSEVVGEMKDIEEKAARDLPKSNVHFGQMYFGSREQQRAMQSVYPRYMEEIGFSPFTSLEAFAILLRHYPSGFQSRNRYINPAAVVSSKIMDRAYASLAAEGKSWSEVRLDEAVSQFEEELLRNMDRRWADITFHQQ